MKNSPGPQSLNFKQLKVDFVNQTSISNSKCYTDLETIGRVECKWLTLFLSELPLQIPEAPQGCQNNLNALYKKSLGHSCQCAHIRNAKLSCWASSPSLQFRVMFLVFPEYLCSKMRHSGAGHQDLPLLPSQMFLSLPEERRMSHP